MAAARSADGSLLLPLWWVGVLTGCLFDDALGNRGVKVVVDSFDEEDHAPRAPHDDPNPNQEKRPEGAQVDVGLEPENAGSVDKQ